MKTLHLLFAPMLVLLFSHASISQSLIWQRQIINPDLPAVDNMGFPIVHGGFKDVVTAPDGRIYSTGYFMGKSAQLGSITLHADTSIFPLFSSGHFGNQDYNVDFFKLYNSTPFIACQDVSGNFLWAYPFQTDLSFLTHDFMIGWHTYPLSPSHNSGYKITNDTDGNIYVAANFYVDTLVYRNQSIAIIQNPGSTTDGILALLIMKLNQNGDLLWHKVIENKNAQLFAPQCETMKVNDGVLQLALTHNGIKIGATTYFQNLNEEGNNLAHIRVNTANGDIITTHSTAFNPILANVGFQKFYISTQFFPDGSLMIAEYTVHNQDNEKIETKVKILNSNLTVQEEISFKIIGVADNYFFAMQPSVIRKMADGTFHFYFYTVFGNGLNIQDCKLKVNQDTIPINWLQNADDNHMLLVKMANSNCVKQVKALGYWFEGDIEEMGDGSFVCMGTAQHPKFISPLVNVTSGSTTFLSNRNGHLTPFNSTLVPFFHSPSNWSFNTFQFPVAFSANSFKFTKHQNLPLGIAGGVMAKYNFTPAPVADSSALFCLSQQIPTDPSTPPMAAPAGGNYQQAQMVTLSSAVGGTRFIYTLDGSTPAVGSSSTLIYNFPISISETSMLKAMAIEPGKNVSPAVTHNYTFGVSDIAADLKKDAFGMFPNPAKESVTVQLADGINATTAITVSDLTGKTLLTTKQRSENGSIMISLKGLKAGTYLLRVENGAQSTVKRLVKD